MERLNELESLVIQAALAGDDPVLATLRSQVARAQVRSREFTGVGFFTELAVDADAPRVDHILDGASISDVVGVVRGLEHGARFVLFVSRGCISTLEGASCDEPWPEDAEIVSLAYSPPGPRRLDILLRRRTGEADSQ